MQDFGLDDGASGLLIAKVGARQKDLPDADRIVGRIVTGPLCLLTEEVLRHFDPDTGAVARLAVGVHRAAVPDILERLDAHLDDFALRLAIERGNEAHAASVLLELFIIGVRLNEFLALFEVFFDCVGHVRSLGGVKSCKARQGQSLFGGHRSG